jgi:hypothetical protein
MPTFAVARWATARMVGLVAGNAASNRFKKFRKPESKVQNIAFQTSALILAIVVATLVATATESAIDAVAPDSWNNN